MSISMQCLLFALVFGGAVAQFSIASNTSATEKLIGSSRLKAPEQQRQYKICSRRKALSTYHYRAITSDGFWGPGSFQYDVTLKENDCSYPQNINSDDLKVWWEAYGTGNYALPTGSSLYLIDEAPYYLVMEYNDYPENVQIRLSFVSLYSNSASLPGSTYDFDKNISSGWSTKSSLTSTTKSSIDASITGLIGDWAPTVSASVSREVTSAASITNQASTTVEVKLHLDLSVPVYVYQTQVTGTAPGYGDVIGYGGYTTTNEPLPPISVGLSRSFEQVAAQHAQLPARMPAHNYFVV